MVWQCWGDLLTTVRTGEPAFPRVFEDGSFEYFADHPEEAAVFDEAMGSFTAMISGAGGGRLRLLVHARRSIDVGGGDGALLTGILRANPSLQGTVFDLPRLAEGARGRSRTPASPIAIGSSAAISSRRSPTGFDAYLLKHVIHDWDDATPFASSRTVGARWGPKRSS